MKIMFAAAGVIVAVLLSGPASAQVAMTSRVVPVLEVKLCQDYTTTKGALAIACNAESAWLFSPEDTYVDGKAEPTGTRHRVILYTDGQLVSRLVMDHLLKPDDYLSQQLYQEWRYSLSQNMPWEVVPEHIPIIQERAKITPPTLPVIPKGTKALGPAYYVSAQSIPMVVTEPDGSSTKVF